MLCECHVGMKNMGVFLLCMNREIDAFSFVLFFCLHRFRILQNLQSLINNNYKTILATNTPFCSVAWFTHWNFVLLDFLSCWFLCKLTTQISELNGYNFLCSCQVPLSDLSSLASKSASYPVQILDGSKVKRCKRPPQQWSDVFIATKLAIKIIGWGKNNDRCSRG